MRRAVLVAWSLVMLGALPAHAQETPFLGVTLADLLGDQTYLPPRTVSAVPPPASTAGEAAPVEVEPWHTAWGLAGISIIPAGPRTAPNGDEYHPNFNMDLDVNFWVWRNQGLYLFADMQLWGETSEFGVTNGRDGALGTSKREFDLDGGIAWNYYGPWEARAFGYTDNNLNRGTNPLTPVGFTDGFGLENRYYLSPEYAKLGQTGFDVARATFVSIGYYPSKDMVGNNGQTFEPGLMLRAYLTYDLWSRRYYAFADTTFISDSSLAPRLLLFDVGCAARPFSFCPQCEFRLGVDNTADFQARNVENIWYASFRYIF